MEASNALLLDMGHSEQLDEASRTHHTPSENSCHELDSICAVSYNVSIDNADSSIDYTDIKTSTKRPVTKIKRTTISPRKTTVGHKLEDVIRMRANMDNRPHLNTLESMVDSKYLSNDSVDYIPPKETVEYGFGNQNDRAGKYNPRYAAGSDTLKAIGDGQCVSTIYTTISLIGMLIALLIPALFHICCQFRLYGSLSQLSERVSNQDNTAGGGTYILKSTRTLLDHLSEFENFFFIGVFLYLTIQIIGFYATQVRIRHYLWRLCFISVEMSKHEFLYGSKQRAMEHFSDYVKRIYRGQTQACRQTEQNLVKAFDEASSKFDNYQVENIWNKIAFLRCRIMFLRIYVPIFINVVMSIGAAAFVYDRRFRMYHKVPLAHPDIVSNLYWYAAIQYEGFWCIFAIFLLNIITWLYLCNINRHKTIFGLLEEAQSQIHAVIFDFSSKLAKEVWDNQMLLFSSTLYAMDSNKTSQKAPYTPMRLETLNSQINFGSVLSTETRRPCICHFLCMPEVEEYPQGSPSFIGGSPFEDLHIPLLETGLHGNYRNKLR
ncbi:transmembrane protein [Babesia ovis]|uniref:Transmembrane protein n=1 Tax=Babesia ovis TaxID=5869 RepID=A0A9W5TF52_BABOV|nr:transmembrane protein [Babesia ovis]